MTRVAIFDRDATIIDIVRDEELGAISVAFHPHQLKILDGAIEGMRALQDAGFVLAIATNQPAPAKGQFSAQAVRRTNDALIEQLAASGRTTSALRGLHGTIRTAARGATPPRRRLRPPKAGKREC